MIQIKLFARLREQIGVSQLNWPLEQSITLAQLCQQLAEHDEAWQQLVQGQVLCAVNHQQVDFDSVVHAGDEVAFFPPVTGG